MRLVYVNADPGIPLWGNKGASVHVRAMLRALAPRVSALTAVSTRLGDPTGHAPLPCRILRPGESGAGAGRHARGELRALAANDATARTLDDLAARGEMDAVLERYSLWSVAGASASLRCGVPWTLEVNAPLVEEAAEHRALSLRSAASFLERSLWREASRVLVVSEALALRARSAGVSPERIRVLPNGYDDTLFHPVDPPAAGAGQPFTLAFVGSLKPWHGVEFLVDAFLRAHAEEPTFRLLLVGDGPLAGRIRNRLASSVPDSAFRMTGAVAHDDVPGLLRAAHVAVAPYPSRRDFYFSPLKVVEYAALGLPIVASGVGQIAELFEDGASALLTEPGDVPSLCRAFRRLRSDAELRARLGSAAHDAVRDRTWDAVSERVLRATAECLSAPTQVRA